jgi:hypothetical protein
MACRRLTTNRVYATTVIDCYPKAARGGNHSMPINRVFTLAAIFAAATILIYLSSRPRHELRQPRVYLAEVPIQTDAQLAQATKYLREACPDVVLINDTRRAEYRLNAFWNGAQGWVVIVSRKDLPFIFQRVGGPDAMQTFRQVCTDVRNDAKELADFDASTQSLPVGRYSLYAANPDRVFLLDTKTGAVWELKPNLKDIPEFERISVEGLYDNRIGP